MLFEVLVEHRAGREISRLPVQVRRRIWAAFEQLELDPYRSRPGCDIKAISGEPGLRRIRVGAYRALYTVEAETRLVRVTKIAHRSEVYD